ncbi:MAG: hypothetical protein L6427_06950 [Actinomycetia bacterium]|nr:hypothetical protein [Actinomycetes bacterium]
MVLDIGSSRLLLESTGWLVAHRRSRAWQSVSPVHFHWNSLSGEAPSGHPLSSGEQEWGSWSLMLFRKLALAADDTATPNEP